MNVSFTVKGEPENPTAFLVSYEAMPTLGNFQWGVKGVFAIERALF